MARRGPRIPFAPTQVSWHDLPHFGAGERDGWLRLVSEQSDVGVQGIELRLRWETGDDGRPRWTGLLVVAQEGYELDSATLRLLRLGLIARHGAFVSAMATPGQKWPSQSGQRVGRPPRKGDDNQHHWMSVASDYRSARSTHPDKPITELARMYGVSVATASRRVKRARELGYLDAAD